MGALRNPRFRTISNRNVIGITFCRNIPGRDCLRSHNREHGETIGLESHGIAVCSSFQHFRFISEVNHFGKNILLLILKFHFYLNRAIRLNLFIVIYDRNIECFGIEKIFYFCINSLCCIFDIFLCFNI